MLPRYLNFWVSIILSTFIVTFHTSCIEREPPIPKPRGYFRITFPEKQYQLFDSIGFPYSFSYPTYSHCEPKNDNSKEPFWLNIHYPSFKATMHISYKKSKKDISTFIDDARELVYKHTVKADAIQEKTFTNQQEKVYGIIYMIKGDAASSVQFYVTDSIEN
ncbi:MAG: hypothetical protein SNJ71_05435, partial [Bacteroidales bacterium]